MRQSFFFIPEGAGWEQKVVPLLERSMLIVEQSILVMDKSTLFGKCSMLLMDEFL